MAADIGCDNRYFPYVIAISAITIAYIIVLVVLYFIHLLLPIVVMITSFILFVLWLVALVKVSIELWGPLGSVNDNCVRFVYQSGWWGGQTLDTLARIQQEGVCNLWKTVFAMEMVSLLSPGFARVGEGRKGRGERRGSEFMIEDAR